MKITPDGKQLWSVGTTSIPGAASPLGVFSTDTNVEVGPPTALSAKYTRLDCFRSGRKLGLRSPVAVENE